jgi:hypothetical protein
VTGLQSCGRGAIRSRLKEGSCSNKCAIGAAQVTASGQYFMWNHSPLLIYRGARKDWNAILSAPLAEDADPSDYDVCRIWKLTLGHDANADFVRIG